LRFLIGCAGFGRTLGSTTVPKSAPRAGMKSKNAQVPTNNNPSHETRITPIKIIRSRKSFELIIC
jgi:hypothetical protein